MSVAPMKKVQLVAYRADADRLLEAVQKVGAVEFSVEEKVDGSSPTGKFPYSSLLPRVQQAVRFLERYEKPKTLWRTLRDGNFIPVLETQVEDHLHNADVVEPVVKDIEDLHLQLNATAEKLRQLKEDEFILKPWLKLSLPIPDLDTTSSKTYLLTHTDSRIETALNVEVEEKLSAYKDIAYAIEIINHGSCAVTVYKSEATEVTITAIIKELNVEIVALPEVEGKVTDALNNIREEIIKVEEEEARLHAVAETMAREHLRDLRIKYDVLQWYAERHSVLNEAYATDKTLVFSGWLNSGKDKTLERELKNASVLYSMSEIEVDENEEPPVEITNSAFVQPFEVVTRLYGMPGYRDLDPTPFLAGFFFLFFGLSLTDVGYGLVLMAVSILIVFVFKVSDTVRLFGKLLFFMGLASALVGLAFGGYLGIDPQTMPVALQALQQFDPIGNPLPVFYLALALGVFQVMVGMILKIVSDARNGHLLDGVLDQGPWLSLFGFLIGYGLASQDIYATAYTQQFLYLVYFSLGAIVITSGRKGKTLFQMFQYSLLSLYSSIGYFSDILSYSRLLALGLATTALAFAVNLIADIVRDSVPYVGAVFAILVLLIGHLFTLAVNTLGAFIHSARLQFVEFFGKFITGTGRMFRPFIRQGAYITVVKDD